MGRRKDFRSCCPWLKIFDLAAHGCGAAKIARILYDEKVPTPAYWKYIRHGKFSYVFMDAPPDKAYSWSLPIIRNILKDETYIGNTIHNKQSTVSYKNKKIVQRPEEEWVRNRSEARRRVGPHRKYARADHFQGCV